MDKTEKALDRLAKAMEELVKVQKEQLKIMKMGHRLSEFQYENTLKALARIEETNVKIDDQISETEEEINKWDQSS